MQGLHSFNLVSGNLLVNFSGPFNLASDGLLWKEECWHLPFVGGFSSIMNLKILLCVSLGAEPGPCCRAGYCFLAPPPLFSASPSFLDERLSGYTLWDSGKDEYWSLFPTNKVWGIQKCFHAQEPNKVLLHFTTLLFTEPCFTLSCIEKKAVLYSYLWSVLSFLEGIQLRSSSLLYLDKCCVS